jgi:hypothetical protein
MNMRYIEFSAYLRGQVVVAVGDGHEGCFGQARREIAGVDLSEPAESDEADLQTGFSGFCGLSHGCASASAGEAIALTSFQLGRNEVSS